MLYKKIIILALSLFFFLQCSSQNKDIDVLIIGGGASGVTAGIQAARLGATTVILEETPWLGGMLTSAGVSAIDGNYHLHSGLWEEFRQNLYDFYGGADSVKTGWVSNVLFEPHRAAKLLKQMTDVERNCSVYAKTVLTDIQHTESGWQVLAERNGKKLHFSARIIIDATELGDVAARVGIPYDIGMDSRFDTGEEIAPEEANNIVQDLTYVAILKDYGPDADKTITPPDDYDPAAFYCTCAGRCDQDSIGRTLWPCNKMMTYGKLPNGYYMINWPIYGNDYYVNVIEKSPAERQEALQKAKNFTLGYIYYLQSELGYKHLGIADDVYPTEDGLPFIPYHRESRRIHGKVRFTVNDLARPFDQKLPLYRTGVAVGDYPVDHHHAAYPDAASLPDLHFYPVPSYSLPLGTLIPEQQKNFIVAEKSISVTNIVNGTTRLQPVCLLIGQAAGTLAALAAKENLSPDQIPVRLVQDELLASGAYLLPYSDVQPERATFKAIQRIGATGLLRGTGKNIGWENHTLFYPDSLLTAAECKIGLQEWLSPGEIELSKNFISLQQAVSVIETLRNKFEPSSESDGSFLPQAQEILNAHGMPVSNLNAPITREQYALLLDQLFDPFHRRPVDIMGGFFIADQNVESSKAKIDTAK